MIIYLNGLEFDCDVEFEPAEPDVGYMSDNAIINSVMLNGVDISAIVSEDFIFNLEAEVIKNAKGSDYDYD